MVQITVIDYKSKPFYEDPVGMNRETVRIHYKFIGKTTVVHE